MILNRIINKTIINFTNFSEIKIIIVGFMLIVLSFIVIPNEVLAGSNSGFYIGAGAGTSSVKANGSDAIEGSYSFDNSDSATKLFGGYNFGLVPFIDLAIEAAYIKFGKPNSTFANGSAISFETTGLATFGLVGFNFGPISVFGKTGVINWDTKSVFGATSSSASGSGTAFGVGAKFQISSLAIRTEYEVFDISSVNDLSMVSVSAAFTF